jgi:hypothetical protein
MRIDRKQLVNNIELLYPDASIVVKQFGPRSCLVDVEINDNSTVFWLSADGAGIHVSVVFDELYAVKVILDNLNLTGSHDPIPSNYTKSEFINELCIKYVGVIEQSELDRLENEFRYPDTEYKEIIKKLEAENELLRQQLNNAIELIDAIINVTYEDDSNKEATCSKIQQLFKKSQIEL